jgi:hypothetical protein
MQGGLYKPVCATVTQGMQMNRPKWTHFPAVAIGIIVFDPATTLWLLEETSLRRKIAKTVKMEGIERGTSPTAVANI